MILVTGASSFVGRYIVAELAAKYPKTQIIGTYHRHSPEKLFSRAILSRVSFKCVDLEKSSPFRHLPNRFKAIVHVAARVPKNSSEDEDTNKEIYRVNFYATAQLTAWAEKNPQLRQIILSSTASVYDPAALSISEATALRPISHYTVSKYMAEQFLTKWAERHKITLTILRYSSVYGYGQASTTVLPLFLNRIRSRQTIQLYGGGKRFQDFVYVKDVAAATYQALKRRSAGIFNIASGQKTTMKNLALTLQSCVKRKVALEYLSQADPGMSRKLNIRLAAKKLGFRPQYSLRKGIADSIALERAGVVA